MDADDIGKGDRLKAHNGGFKAIVNGVSYRNAHMDWTTGKPVAYVVQGDPIDPPKQVLNADGSVNTKHANPAVFVVNGDHAKARNLFAQLKPDDVLVNGHTSVMSVTDEVSKAYECDTTFLFSTLFL